MLIARPIAMIGVSALLSMAGGDTYAAPEVATKTGLDSRAGSISKTPVHAPINLIANCKGDTELEMFVGESRVFPTPGISRIAVGTPRVMTAEVLDDDKGRSTILFANGQGATSLHLWSQDGQQQCIRVFVTQGDTTRSAKEIAKFLAGISRARTSIVGEKVIIEGDELSDIDRDKIVELARRYPQIVNFTSSIGWEKMITMDVKVVEFPKSYMKEFGLKWGSTGGASVGAIWAPGGRGDASGLQVNIGGSGLPIVPAIGAQAQPSSALTAMSTINLGLSAQLSLLEQQGTAVMLAEPQLSTRSGYKASFLAGGEFPYSVSNINGVSVIFKPYGIKLEIEPRVGSNGVIRAIVETEVSSLDASVTTSVGPALLTRRTRTEFNVREGETIVLSGLIQRGTNTDIDKVPLLGDIPILGALFRSKRFQNKETELVVFVTPRVADSANHAERVLRTEKRLGRELGTMPQ